ncbi:MAG TPA: hypothetical protein VJT50_08860 [Pyrinomonadaceae bacterium]|nr:hypothetical protein [Pyrinomonadaceae bacterium]
MGENKGSAVRGVLDDDQNVSTNAVDDEASIETVLDNETGINPVDFGELASNVVDDQGTTEVEACELLKRMRDAGFDGDNEKLAIALGRPLEEVEGWMEGKAAVDDDVVMKARGIAQERGLDLE